MGESGSVGTPSPEGPHAQTHWVLHLVTGGGPQNPGPQNSKIFAMRHLLVLLWLLTATSLAFARPKGDHPEVAAYPGAKIADYNFKEFEESTLLLSKPLRQSNGQWQVEKLLPVEGKVTYLRYTVDRTVSALQVFRNYQSSLARSGFQTLFACDRPCLPDGTSLESLREIVKGRNLTYWASRDVQYLAAQRGGTFVSLAVGYWGDEPQAYLFVIEKGQMDTGLMGVTGASPMAVALSSQGKVDVYGFLFDSGKAALKPASTTALNELGQVLRENAQLHITVTGHTDDVGQAAANQALSEARAQAVVAALISEQGISPDRLTPQGKGASQPLVPNGDEAARARNRRVEISVVKGVAAAATRPTTQNPPASSSSGSSGSEPEPTAKPAEPASVKDKVTKLNEAAEKLKRLLGR